MSDATNESYHESDEKQIAQKQARTARYGASCNGCRRRKQRCDAKLPSCSRCSRLKETCVYENNRRQGSNALIPYINKAYEFLHTLRDGGSESKEDIVQKVTDFLKENPYPSTATLKQSLSSQSADRSGTRTARGRSETRDGTVEGGHGHSAADESLVKKEKSEETESQISDVDELLMHMSLADDGQNGHFGMTSMFWQSPSPQVVKRLQRRVSRIQYSPHELSMKHKIKQGEEIWATDNPEFAEEEEAGLLKANSKLLGSWETLAFHKLELETDSSSAKLVIHLLKTYFSWEYGTHCFVYRPVFIRDMALGGQYFNHFLLNVICAYAARFADHSSNPSNLNTLLGVSSTSSARDVETEYLDKAKALLSSEIDKPSSVPTIQGMLLLGQRECVVGNLSQGWMYTGMAFRAMRDMGIHLDCSRLPIFGFGTLSAEDREIRRRLFWSAYTWDKMISLALGRSPTFNAFQNVSPGVMVDDTEDDDLWQPYFHDDYIPKDMENYPVHKSYTTLNFRHVIKLHEVLLKIIMRLYDGRYLRQNNHAFVFRIRQRLESWFNDLPDVIKLDTDALPEHCPPPHIFATNALYRAAWILLYRTFLPGALPLRSTHPSSSLIREASEMCSKMASEMDKLFLLHQKSFSLRNMGYTLLWAMYSAATINAIDFRSTDPVVSSAASPRLGLSLHVLEQGSAQTPGCRRSIEIIKQHLRAPMPESVKRSRSEFDVRTPTTKVDNYNNGYSQLPVDPQQDFGSGTGHLLTQSTSQNDESLQVFDRHEDMNAWLSSLDMSHGFQQYNTHQTPFNDHQIYNDNNMSMDLLQNMMVMPSSQNTYGDWEAFIMDDGNDGQSGFFGDPTP